MANERGRSAQRRGREQQRTDHLRVPRRAMGPVIGDRPVQWRVAGREHRGIVDEPVEERGYVC